MTRIEGVSPDRAGTLVRILYRLSRRQLGRDVDPVAVYAHAPSLLLGYGLFERATSRQGRVEEHLKTLAETKVAAIVNCDFCRDIASSLAIEAGVSENQLRALREHGSSAQFTPLERLVLDYATAMSRTPTAITDELFAALREHFDDRQLVELTSVIALENMRARFNSAFDMTPANFSDGMLCVVAESGSGAAQSPSRGPGEHALRADGREHASA